MVGAVRAWLARPAFQQGLNGSLVLFFIALSPVSAAAGWDRSPRFISHLSILALALACLGGWVSSIVAVKQDVDADVQEVVDILKES